MVEYLASEKELFTAATQMQNIRRLFGSIFQTSQITFNELANAEASREQVWKKLRLLRDLYLKALVILPLYDQTPYIQELINIGTKLFNLREGLRWRTAELFEVQWPPRGSFPAPAPALAIEPAINALVLGDSKMLPKYLKLALTQANCTHVESVKNIRLSEAQHNRITRNLTNSLWSNFALSISQRSMDSIMKHVEFSIVNGRVCLFSPNEYEVTFITDLQLFQFESFRILVGSANCETCMDAPLGTRRCLCRTASDLNVLGSNTLQSSINIICESVEALKGRLQYEINACKAAINAAKETRNKVKNLRSLFLYLEKHQKLGDAITLDYQVLCSLLTEDILNNFRVDNILNASSLIGTETANQELKPDTSPVSGAEDTAEKDSENLIPITLVDFDGLTKRIYSQMRELEYNCLAELEKARDNYQLVDGDEFTFEYYSFICLFCARQSRYSALLILYDQARIMAQSIVAPGGVILCNLHKEDPPWAPSNPSNQTSIVGTDDRTDYSHTPGDIDKLSSQYDWPPWYKLFFKFFPSQSHPSLAETFPHLTRELPFACIFASTSHSVHNDVLDIDFFPGLPLELWDAFAPLPGRVRIPRLRFELNNCNGELTVLLQPLNQLLSDPEVYEDLKDAILKHQDLKFLYTLDEDNNYVPITTHRVNIIRTRKLRLSVYVNKSVNILAHATLHALKLHCELAQLEAVQIKLGLNSLNIYVHEILALTLSIDILTGTLCVDSSRLLDVDGINYAMASNHIQTLISRRLYIEALSYVAGIIFNHSEPV